MTVAVNDTGKSAVLRWTGSQSVFGAGFKALEAKHVSAIYSPDSGEPDRTLAEGVHFTVTLDAVNNVTARPKAMPVPSGDIVFRRTTPGSQDVNFVNLGTYSPEVHEDLADAAAMRDNEIRRDFADIEAGEIGEIAASIVSYANNIAGLPDLTATNVQDAITELVGRIENVATPQMVLTDLTDVNVTNGPAINNYALTWNQATNHWIAVPPAALDGGTVVDVINAELGGTGWQQAGVPGGGDITNGANAGVAGTVSLFKEKNGSVLRFNGVRGLAGGGINAILNPADSSIDFTVSFSNLDARYAQTANLAAVAFSGQYAALSGLPSLGTLAGLNAVGTGQISNGAVTNANLADMPTGTIKARFGTGDGIAQDVLPGAIKSMLDLDLVNNTTDVQKPVSTAQAAAIDAAQTTWKGRVPVTSGAVNLQASEAGMIYECNAAGETEVRILAQADQAYPGDCFYAIIQLSTVQTRVEEQAGVSLFAPDGMRRTRTRYSWLYLYRRATNSWYLTGDLAP